MSRIIVRNAVRSHLQKFPNGQPSVRNLRSCERRLDRERAIPMQPQFEDYRRRNFLKAKLHPPQTAITPTFATSPK